MKKRCNRLKSPADRSRGTSALGIARSKQLIARLVRDVLLPNEELVEQIGADGDIVVAFLDPRPGALVSALQADETVSVARLTRAKASRLYAGCAHSDPVTWKWMTTPPRAGLLKIFLVVHLGTVLLNLVEGAFSIEPGSTDAEFMS